jgi:hypothetical protein
MLYNNFYGVSLAFGQTVVQTHSSIRTTSPVTLALLFTPRNGLSPVFTRSPISIFFAVKKGHFFPPQLIFKFK